MKERYYSFSRYLKERFGERVQRISLDAGFSCPNLDGSLADDGCIYCNNKSFGVYARTKKPLSQQIRESINFYHKRLGVNKFIAYFQSFSNTYAESQELKAVYDQIREFPQIKGLFISTRPDCIDSEKLEVIAQYKKDYLVWLEYGLQSTNNRMLKVLKRRHSYQDFLDSLTLARKYGINIGVHMILGLPGQSHDQVIEDASRLSRLDIQGIKFHLLHAVKDTQLASQYIDGEVSFLTQNEYVNYTCDFLERMPPERVILRLVSDARPSYLVAPSWMKDKHKVLENIREELRRRGTYQGVKYAPSAI